MDKLSIRKTISNFSFPSWIKDNTNIKTSDFINIVDAKVCRVIGNKINTLREKEYYYAMHPRVR